MSKQNILIVDDEKHILELLRYNLESNGYIIDEANSGEEAVEKIQAKEYDLIILDIMLPGIDGLEVLRKIRQDIGMKSLPVILLTAKGSEIDKVVGLELGADDYIVKPFGVYELVARVKSVFRRLEIYRSEVEESTTVHFNDLSIDRDKYAVTKNGEKVTLTHKEFELLYLLAKNPGRVFDREFLLESIWGYEYLGESRTVDVHIRNLRKKLGDVGKTPLYIVTIRGVGYKFIDEGGRE